MLNRNVSLNPPCKNCTERTVSCHSNCVDYIAYSEQRKEINARRAEEYRLRWKKR